MLFAINYHYVRDSFEAPYPSIFGVTPERFEFEARLLAGTARLIDGRELVRRLDQDRGTDAVSAVITFDDGLREQFELARPILNRLGIPALYFVNTAPRMEGRMLTVHKLHLLRAHVAPETLLRRLQSHAESLGIELAQPADPIAPRRHYRYDSPEAAKIKYQLNFLLDARTRRRLVSAVFAACFADRRESDMADELYMTEHQMRELSRTDALGSHSHDHVPLGLLTDAEIRRQIRVSLTELTKLAGKRPVAMSYPYGSRTACSLRVGEAASREGIRVGFTMERAGNPDFARPLFLGRYSNTDLPFDQGAEALRRFFAGAPSADWGEAATGSPGRGRRRREHEPTGKQG